MKYTLAILAILSLTACGEPRILNAGAAVPVTAVDGPNMDRISGSYDVVGRYQRDAGVSPHIYLLSGSERESTFCHELAHMADDNGGDYAAAIRSVTPPNPTARFAERIKVAWEIAHTPGGYWKAIYERWGDEGVEHKEILAKIKN